METNAGETPGERKPAQAQNTQAPLLARQSVEEALLESEERFRATFSQVAVGIAIASLEGRFEEANTKMSEILGYSEQELYALSVLDVTHPDDVATTRENIRKLLAGEVAHYTCEKRYVRKDGQLLWSRTTVTILRGADGRPRKFIGVLEDITQNRRAEQALLESQTRLNLAMQAGRMGAWEWIIGEGRVIWSQTLEAIHGLKPGTFGGTIEAFQSDMHPDDRPGVLEKIGNCLSTHEEYRVEYRIIKPDGKIAWVEACGKLFLSDRGEPERMVGICMDITERKQTEEARFRLAALVESSDEAIISKTLTGVISTWNQGAQRMFGYTAQEVVGKPISILIPPERIDEEPAILEKVKQGIPVEHYETIRMRKDGTILDVSLTISPIKDGSGKIVGASKILRDIHDRKVASQQREYLLEAERRARAEAERLNIMKDQFLATLSHELRTPLSAILGWSHLLASGKLAPDGIAKGLEVISRNARAQSQLIEELLDMSRIDSGKVKLEAKRVDLASVVSAAVTAMEPTAQGKRIQLQTHFDPDLGTVWGDPGRLQQIVWNLLSNAVKFTPNGGKVDVHVSKRGEGAAICVSDTGAGIAEDFLPFVFDRFRQGDASTTREHGGLGLGLSIVKHLVELHGGTIQASSPGKGKGATFTFTIAAAGENAGQESGSAGPRKETAALGKTALSGVRILVVEDEQDARELVRRVLAECKAHVFTASNAAEGLAMLKGHRPAVIISDIGMPGEDGYQLIRRVRELEDAALSGIPAIAMTAFARPEDQSKAIAAGFQVHLAKPVEPDHLVSTIAQLVRTNAQASAARAQ